MQVQETSREAFQRVQPTTQMRETILAYIRGRGEDGATCDEAQAALNILAQTASARFRDLAMAEQIVNTGRKRATRSGCGAFVWTAAP